MKVIVNAHARYTHVIFFGVQMKYVKYQSLVNSVGLERNIECYWEIDERDFVIRSVEKLPAGQLVRYSQEHSADSFGQLPEGTITEGNLVDLSYGETTKITAFEFEQLWMQKAINIS
jgi:hypothetical protein